jgi:hypothetical protein
VSEGPVPTHDPETAPPPDRSHLSALQLVAIMGGTLLAAVVVLYVVSG